MSDLLKSVLVKIGRHCSPYVIHRLNAATNYLEVGRWCEAHGFGPGSHAVDRFALFDAVGTEIANREVVYLEFGVWKGDTMRYWAKLLKNPNSVLHGFDSFEGLPERWNLASGQHAFSVAGAIPQIADSRVRFFKGWFKDTLENYRVPNGDVLFVTLDADLYSSTKTVLDALEGDLHPGTYIYFDEFCDRMHEMRAFGEFLERTQTQYRLVGADPTLTNVLFQRVA